MLQLCLHKSSSDSTTVVTGPGINSDYIGNAHANQGFGFLDAFLLECQWLLLSQISVLAGSGKPWKSRMDKAAIAIYLLDGNRIAAQNWDSESFLINTRCPFSLLLQLGLLQELFWTYTHVQWEAMCSFFSLGSGSPAVGLFSPAFAWEWWTPSPKEFCCGHSVWAQQLTSFAWGPFISSNWSGNF